MISTLWQGVRYGLSDVAEEAGRVHGGRHYPRWRWELSANTSILSVVNAVLCARSRTAGRRLVTMVNQSLPDLWTCKRRAALRRGRRSCFSQDYTGGEASPGRAGVSVMPGYSRLGVNHLGARFPERISTGRAHSRLSSNSGTASGGSRIIGQTSAQRQQLHGGRRDAARF